MCLLFLPLSASALTKYTTESSAYAIRYVFGDVGGAMVAIAHCESRLNNDTEVLDTNNKKSRGLLQLNGSNGDFEGWDIPYLNALKAKELYDKNGFYPWYNCARSLKLIKDS